MNDNLSEEELTRIIAHEMAIAIDFKMYMFYTTYLIGEESAQKNIWNFWGLADGTDSEELGERLRVAFNSAHYNPIAYTFASMRAVNVENFIINKKYDNGTVMNHTTCKEAFNKLFPIFEKNIENYKRNFVERNNLTSEESLDLLKDRFFEINPMGATDFMDKSELAKTLEMMLDEKFILSRPYKMTFCQYMATPHFTNKSTYNLFSNGPRPRLVGGWLTEPQTNNQVNTRSVLEIINEDIQSKFTSTPEQ